MNQALGDQVAKILESAGGNVGRWRQVKTLANGVLYVPAFDG